MSWNCALKNCHNILLSLYLALYPGWASLSYEGLDPAGFSFPPGGEGWLPGRKKTWLDPRRNGFPIPDEPWNRQSHSFFFVLFFFNFLLPVRRNGIYDSRRRSHQTFICTWLSSCCYLVLPTGWVARLPLDGVVAHLRRLLILAHGVVSPGNPDRVWRQSHRLDPHWGNHGSTGVWHGSGVFIKEMEEIILRRVYGVWDVVGNGGQGVWGMAQECVVMDI